jgi:nitroimidazol reductase NimA-like FMN-containing flavoprotein (pyridoxamine 5'-phosphate oxidase superfamily)
MTKFPKTDLNKVIRGSNRAKYDYEAIYQILDAGFMGHVSYIYDGMAICIPMAYARKADKIYLHGSLKNRTFLSLLDNKGASMTVTHLDGLVLARSGFHHSVNYRSATLFGSIKRIDDKQEKEEILEAIVEQMIPGRWAELREMSAKELKSTLVVELTIQSASAKIRAEGVNDEKEDQHLPIWAGVVPIRQVSEFPEIDPDVPKEVDIPAHVLSYYHKHKW